MEKSLERSQDRIGWIRDLVRSEEQMEESGLVDMGTGADDGQNLMQESLQYLQTLKMEFIEAASAFNEMKASPLGRVKIYGIAKTHADFMLFRNGFKMIFSIKAAGQISIKFNFLGPNYTPSQNPSLMNTASTMMEENLLEAKLGPFQDLQWCYKGEQTKVAAVVKYHLTLFIKESTK